jgi:Large ribosomal RNA subunit accumulation protein YceD
MPERDRNRSEMPWHVVVAVEDIPETGEHMMLVADAEMRLAIARMAGLRELPRLEADFALLRQGDGGLRVTGRVSATVGQNCVVTLEPLQNVIEEDVDLLYMPAAAAAAADGETPAEPKWDDPEPLIGGAVDLGALTTEFVILGIDPYPRKAGAVFEPAREQKPDPGPFAALAGLMKDRDGH